MDINEICTYIFYHLVSTSQINYTKHSTYTYTCIYIYIFFSMKISLIFSHLISMSQIIYKKNVDFKNSFHFLPFNTYPEYNKTSCITYVRFSY